MNRAFGKKMWLSTPGMKFQNLLNWPLLVKKIKNDPQYQIKYSIYFHPVSFRDVYWSNEIMCGNSRDTAFIFLFYIKIPYMYCTRIHLARYQIILLIFKLGIWYHFFHCWTHYTGCNNCNIHINLLRTKKEHLPDNCTERILPEVIFRCFVQRAPAKVMYSLCS